ncbi:MULTISPECIES: ATP-binding protein [Kosmotoga]|uniref:ATP-binding protein n=1 Tax=Kosmotoga TaxID=651456 RepID=UPI0002EDC323|nr:MULTISPECIES: ATP-binding protein [Kosmotoga]MDI3524496.1 hypothetical protein [Kosmotoga sp.]MDK2952646.1 hypothetical protein [Kosmotoga sp.]
MGLRTIADHILDICQNAVDAGASQIKLSIEEIPGERFSFVVEDNGKGIPEEKLKEILDPFYTEKKKKVKFGLGLPMLKFASESTGGSFSIQSKPGVGTKVSATFNLSNIDCQPVGDLASAIFSAITMEAGVNWQIVRVKGQNGYSLTTEELKKILGDDFYSNPMKMKKIMELLNMMENSLGG